MFRRLFFLMFTLLASLVTSLVISAIVLWNAKLRPMQQTWGIEPADTTRELPGDTIVPEPTISDTRSVTIDASADQVWPWLPQMGFGRAGWYSYDKLDNSGGSVRHIMPEYQAIKTGDVVPTFPGGGFRVESLEPGKSMVLYLDSDIVKEQAAAQAEGANGSTETQADGAAATEMAGKPGAAQAAGLQPGLKAAGAMGGMTMPDFKASWAFVLDPVDDAHTRLIERFRVETPTASKGQKLGMPFMGMGVFLMERKQMLGIKERAEQGPESETAAEPAPAGA